MKYSNPWKRFLAYIIDYFILSIPLTILMTIMNIVFFSANAQFFQEIGQASQTATQEVQIQMLTQLMMVMIPYMIIAILITAVIFWLYFAWMESSSMQATLGKKVLSMKVADENGQKLSFGKATGRFILKYLSSMIFIIFIVAFFNDKKQAVHDMLVHTIVYDEA